jgi:hypothetical protein
VFSFYDIVFKEKIDLNERKNSSYSLNDQKQTVGIRCVCGRSISISNVDIVRNVQKNNHVDFYVGKQCGVDFQGYLRAMERKKKAKGKQQKKSYCGICSKVCHSGKKFHVKCQYPLQTFCHKHIALVESERCTYCKTHIFDPHVAFMNKKWDLGKYRGKMYKDISTSYFKNILSFSQNPTNNFALWKETEYDVQRWIQSYAFLIIYKEKRVISSS